jgi:ABC-2 type transport system permease protein
MPIFDQGYQHWTGHLSSRPWRWLAITRRGVRTALQGRLIRLFLFIAWLPAAVLAFALCMWGLVERQSDLVESIRPYLTSLLGLHILADPRDYRIEIWTICFHYFLSLEVWFSMVLVLLVGPNLISQDLRYNALPLYFSRPLSRTDYFIGKLGVIVALLGMAIVLPALVAYVLGLLFSLDISIIRDTAGILLGSVVYGLVIALSAGMLMLALSSLSRNSRYVALAWMGFWIISTTASAILMEVHQERQGHRVAQQGGKLGDAELIARGVEARKSDWRPIVSYTGNLRRVGERLLDTNAAWKKFSEIVPGERAQFLKRMADTQYPWYWSAAVLLALFGVSACILNISVKPLDRLK